MRAEVIDDVLLFVSNAPRRLTGFKVHQQSGFHDVEFEFETESTLDEIIKTLSEIDDAHVMYQTVQPIEHYTGERNYDLVL